ncbi:Peptidyl-dipeptidase dcp [Rathayibacter tanaceti]|uniref:Peptidyl-dipeptidase dcp n=1 Tax=Rathayibacter tanaceti TaxID=1671680 RepID=A0A166INC8_9MICO|nr:Peptidyl-dipeptidase dcp [Rathayibacter tanaceti]
MSAPDPVAVLLEPSVLPHGLPNFASVDPEAYRPAFLEAMRRHRAEIEAIAGSSESPSIENTLVALERAGRELRRVSAVFFTVSASDRTPLTDALEAELAPLLSAHDDAVTLEPRLFSRLRDLADRAPRSGWTPRPPTSSSGGSPDSNGRVPFSTTTARRGSASSTSSSRASPRASRRICSPSRTIAPC